MHSGYLTSSLALGIFIAGIDGLQDLTGGCLDGSPPLCGRGYVLGVNNPIFTMRVYCHLLFISASYFRTLLAQISSANMILQTLEGLYELPSKAKA